MPCAGRTHSLVYVGLFPSTASCVRIRIPLIVSDTATSRTRIGIVVFTPPLNLDGRTTHDERVSRIPIRRRGHEEFGRRNLQGRDSCHRRERRHVRNPGTRRAGRAFCEHGINGGTRPERWHYLWVRDVYGQWISHLQGVFGSRLSAALA